MQLRPHTDSLLHLDRRNGLHVLTAKGLSGMQDGSEYIPG
jgi:hypothetical protein